MKELRPSETKELRARWLPHPAIPNVVGGWWSLVIVRDAFAGIRRFSDFQRSLGLARNILTTRLKELVAQGILTTEPASDGSAYQEYVLTDKGKALLPVMSALAQWGKAYLFQNGESPSPPPIAPAGGSA
jgi:DNA-binding HxlR family transcriptional regulator